MQVTRKLILFTKVTQAIQVIQVTQDFGMMWRLRLGLRLRLRQSLSLRMRMGVILRLGLRLRLRLGLILGDWG